jgi:hypothetical protein
MTNGRCRLHGGKTPGGIASPHWKHGRFSRYLPQGLRQDYERAASDPELGSLRSIIALLRCREFELLRAMQEPPAWDQAVEALDDLHAARESGDPAEQDAAFVALHELVGSGAGAQAGYDGLWREVLRIIREIDRATAAELRRLAALGGVVTITDLMNVIQAFLIGIRERVDDQETLQDIQALWNRLVGAKAGPPRPSPLAISIVAGDAAE